MSSRPRKKARVSLADALANGSAPATILQLLAEVLRILVCQFALATFEILTFVVVKLHKC
jgi:hypothetical protein